jgi:hypothetical protein
MAVKPEVDTQEFTQARMEKSIREQCELHGWATAVSVANPVDILIMLEEYYDEEINPLPKIRSIKESKTYAS